MKRVSLFLVAFLIVMLFLPLYQTPKVKAQESEIGYELLDDNKILRIWNKCDSYYFNVSSGIQFSNHYEEYWSHNVMGIGYRDVEDAWHVIYWTDSLSGFSKGIETDNATFVNATLWRDLSYYTYDFRLAIRYCLRLNDTKLTVQPYIKNLGIDIPYNLGFAWRLKDIKISDTYKNDLFSISWIVNENLTDGESYFLNQTLDNTYLGSNNITGYNVKDVVQNQVLELDWQRKIQNRTKLVVKSTTEYNAPITLFINVGTLSSGQEKTTLFFWKDADLIDSYSETNRNADAHLRDLHPSNSEYWSAEGQTFTTPASPQYKITSCKFYMQKGGAPTGNGHAVLYAESGGKPTGGALATSDAYDVSTLPTSQALVEFTFSGDEQYTMSVSTPYCIVFQCPTSGTIDTSNYVEVAFDSTSPTHSGQCCYYVSNAWETHASIDTCFYVYGDAVEGEFTEEFAESIGISASLYSWKALFYRQTETITVTTTSYAWGEYPRFFIETTTITEQISEWIELRQVFTESITLTEQMSRYVALFRLFQETISPTETSSFNMELALVITEFVETVGIDASLFLWKAQQMFFEETVNPTANFYKWIALADIFTETIRTSELQQFLKEKLFHVTETINISDSLTALTETLVTIIEFTETIAFSATMYLTLPTEVAEAIDLALIVAAFALIMVLGAWGILSTKKSEEEE